MCLCHSLAARMKILDEFRGVGQNSNATESQAGISGLVMWTLDRSAHQASVSRRSPLQHRTIAPNDCTKSAEVSASRATGRSWRILSLSGPSPQRTLRPYLRSLMFHIIWEYGFLFMGTHMKTTIDVSDALLEAAKQHARARGTTLRSVVEEGLRTVLANDAQAVPFRLRDGSVDGQGIRPEVREGGWERIVELAYEGHGG